MNAPGLQASRRQATRLQATRLQATRQGWPYYTTDQQPQASRQGWPQKRSLQVASGHPPGAALLYTDVS